jgi:hypothetical protein
LIQIDIRDTNGISLKKRWSQGVYSYLGLAVSGFPNLFYMYGPQSPSAFCNGPTCAEIQGDWIADTIDYMEKNKLRRIEANHDAEIEYKKLVNTLVGLSLLGTADRSVNVFRFTVTCFLLSHFVVFSAGTMEQTFQARFVRSFRSLVVFLYTGCRLAIAQRMVTRASRFHDSWLRWHDMLCWFAATYFRPD